MGNTLTEALKNDQIEDIKENSTPNETQDNPANTTENEFDTDEELV